MAKRDQDQHKTQSFLSRWSQRKQAAEQEAEAPERKPDKGAAATAVDPTAVDPTAVNPAAVDPAAVDPTAVDTTGTEGAGFDLKDLPDIDSMDASSDFTVFLRAGVPKALKRRALRKLWRVDPVLGFIDGLDDYNLDYTDAATVVPNMKTLYQVGKGMILPEDEAAEAEAEAQAKAQAEADTTEAAAQDLAAGNGEAGEVAARDQDRLAAPAEAPMESRAEPELPVVSETAEAVKRKRNPGDPLVSNSAAAAKVGRRATAPHQAARSARSRRWGDSDS